MFLILGLGNPGIEYEATRHNVGFMVLDWIAHKHQVQFQPGTGAFYFSRIKLGSQDVYLLEPWTFMNRSGMALEQAREQLSFEIADVLVVYDDFNLPFGTLRLRRAGGDGGHNGLASVMYHMQSEKIARMRIGIRNEDFSQNAADFVLSNFEAVEQEHLPHIIEQSALAAESVVLNGIMKSMNQFNKNVLLEA